MEVAELTGALMDFWVARAEGHTVDSDGDLLDVRENSGAPTPYRPSTDWTQGGPLIEKYKMGFGLYLDSPNSYFAVTGLNEVFGEGYGATHLIAACRAVVRAKFGDEVPDAIR